MTSRLQDVMSAVPTGEGTDRGSLFGNQIEWLLWNVRELYREVPGLALTADEVAETFQLDPAKADAVLMALVDTRFLSRQSGRFVLSSQANPQAWH